MHVCWITKVARLANSLPHRLPPSSKTVQVSIAVKSCVFLPGRPPSAPTYLNDCLENFRALSQSLPNNASCSRVLTSSSTIISFPFHLPINSPQTGIQDSSVSIVSMIRNGRPSNRSSIPGRVKFCFSTKCWDRRCGHSRFFPYVQIGYIYLE